MTINHNITADKQTNLSLNITKNEIISSKFWKASFTFACIPEIHLSTPDIANTGVETYLLKNFYGYISASKRT